MLTGEEIRQEAARREATCSEGMRGSFYHGFREGAKWASKVAEEHNLTWEDMQRIADAMGHTAKLTKEGTMRPSEEYYTEVLMKFNAKG